MPHTLPVYNRETYVDKISRSVAIINSHGHMHVHAIELAVKTIMNISD